MSDVWGTGVPPDIAAAMQRFDDCVLLAIAEIRPYGEVKTEAIVERVIAKLGDTIANPFTVDQWSALVVSSLARLHSRGFLDVHGAS